MHRCAANARGTKAVLRQELGGAECAKHTFVLYRCLMKWNVPLELPVTQKICENYVAEHIRLSLVVN